MVFAILLRSAGLSHLTFKDRLVPKGKVRDYEARRQLPTVNQMIHKGLRSEECRMWPTMVSTAHNALLNEML